MVERKLLVYCWFLRPEPSSCGRTEVRRSHVCYTFYAFVMHRKYMYLYDAQITWRIRAG